MSGSVRVRNHRYLPGQVEHPREQPFKWRYYRATKREVARQKLEFLTPRHVAEIRTRMRLAEQRAFMDQLALSRAIQQLSAKYGVKYSTIVRAYRVGHAL